MGSEHPSKATKTLKYPCARAVDTVVVDGHLNEKSWLKAPRSRLFSDHTGARALFDTTAALVWDDRCLYIGWWLEDRDIHAIHEASSPDIRQDSHVGLLLIGPGAYYDLAVNPLGATAETCCIWKEAYREDTRFHVPEFDLAVHKPEVLGGGSRTDFSAMRWGFSDWRFPGLRVGVQVEGDPNRRDRSDRGWNVELALPWEGFKWLVNGQTASPAPGDVWRIGLLRRQVIDQRGHRWQATWTWQPLDLVDGRIPETHLEVDLCG